VHGKVGFEFFLGKIFIAPERNLFNKKSTAPRQCSACIETPFPSSEGITSGGESLL